MNIIKYLWLKLTGDKCPTCGKTYRDFGNIMMIENIGECGTCDHVRGDVEDIIRDEAHDVENEMGDEESLERFNMDNFGRDK